MRAYNPARPPADDSPASDVIDWQEQELQQVGNSMSTVQDLDIYGIEPTAPQNGMIRFADGNGWDPGYGAGPYVYINGAWSPMFRVIDYSHVAQGGTTLANSTVQSGTGNITATPVPVANYQAREGEDIAVVSDPVAGTIQFLEEGYWLVGFVLTFDVVSSSSNSTREVASVFYDFNASQVLAGISTCMIPRYGESVTLAGTIRFLATGSSLNNPVGVAVLSTSGDSIAIGDIQVKELWCARVSNRYAPGTGIAQPQYEQISLQQVRRLVL